MDNFLDFLNKDKQAKQQIGYNLKIPNIPYSKNTPVIPEQNPNWMIGLTGLEEPKKKIDPNLLKGLLVQKQPEPVPAPVKINPDVKKYVLKKKEEKKPDTNLASAMTAKDIPEIEKPDAGANSSTSKWLAILGGGLSSAGAGLMGRGAEGANAQMMQNIDEIKNRDIETDLNNPKSSHSIHARELAKQVFGSKVKINPNMTAKQFRESSPIMQHMFDNSFRQEGLDLNKAQLEEQKTMHNQNMAIQNAHLAQQRMSGGSTQKPEKPKTEGERTAQGFYQRMKNSNDILTSLENDPKGYNTSQVSISPIERLKSEQRKKYETAQRDWAMANLRKESGAAIGQDEIQQQLSTYFPQAGDSREVIRQKQIMRDQLNKNMANSAGIEHSYRMIDSKGQQYDIPESQIENAMRDGLKPVR